MSLKIYADRMSQPSRAVLEFCEINKIPYEFHSTSIGFGENRSKQYAKINPFRRVPAIVDGQMNLAQSHTIMRYLSKKHKTPEHWYPREDFKKAAIIDQYLDYHHTGTRRCANLVYNSFIAPTIGLPIYPLFNLQEAQKQVMNVLKFIQSNYLKNTPYIRSNQISIADLAAYNEIIQLRFFNYDFSQFKVLTEWFARMESIKEIQEENARLNSSILQFRKLSEK